MNQVEEYLKKGGKIEVIAYDEKKVKQELKEKYRREYEKIKRRYGK